MLSITTFSFSQDNKPVTSIEEYNYLTQGYKLQLETGGDFKAGYELKPIVEDKAGDFTITYSLMNHISSKTTKAVLITLKKAKDKNDKIIYLCLPFNNQDLFQKFFKETENLGISMKMVFEASMYKALSNSFDKISNRSIK